jgi:hypothetical protein
MKIFMGLFTLGMAIFTAWFAWHVALTTGWLGRYTDCTKTYNINSGTYGIRASIWDKGKLAGGGNYDGLTSAQADSIIISLKSKTP